jgi:type II restriction enzyme
MPEPIDILEDKLMKNNPGLLEGLLVDHTTQKNIFWATDSYADLGEGYHWHDAITSQTITGHHEDIIRPRSMKARDEQQKRARLMAEVFTPSWLVNKMNNAIDEEWFGRSDVFNNLCANHFWQSVTDMIAMPKGKSWQDYVLATRLEITCGEAPFLASRYDTVSGEAIPITNRIGILDRKLRVVNENCTDDSWTRWALLALGSVYGYEWQGDNLLLARMALLATFCDYYGQHFGQKPDDQTMFKAVDIISWNLWQMDGLKGVVPGSCHEDKHIETDLFGNGTTTVTPCLGCEKDDIQLHNGLRCHLRRWLPSDNEQPDYFDCLYLDFITKKYKTHHKTKWPMKFDFVIGNPPYQQESNGANANDAPIYHYFYDAAFKVSDKAELISPARFLFNAGGTPKEWNTQMLQDPHFKVLTYEPNASKIFPSTSINGGIVVTYHNRCKNYGAIRVFTAFPELNSILRKVTHVSTNTIVDAVTNRGLYKYSDLAYKEQPDEMRKTADKRIAPSSFERMYKLFTPEKPDDRHEYIRIYGNVRNQRTFRWFRKDYVDYVENLDKYKVLVSKADGAAGTVGNPVPARIMGKPVMIDPGIGFTETYISIGETNSKNEAEVEVKYLKTKFARTMLGVLKVTQNNAKPTWKYVPLQDFTSSSDIDWSKSIHEIDLQLYDKYGLTEDERNFIETHVKEME